MPLLDRSLAGAGVGREPQSADTRLTRTPGVGPEKVFTCGMSAPEYVLLSEAGFEPLGLVVGSSVYHVGLQAAHWPEKQELQALSRTMRDARQLAVARMRAEADRLGADGVIGVQLRMERYAWGRKMLESVATGTAIKAAGGSSAYRAPDGCAFTLGLSAQDSLRLLAGSAVPVAFVLGTCVYHIAPQMAVQALRQAGPNQEMLPFTQGARDAGELALSHMRAEAAAAKTSGVIGVTVAESSHFWGAHATEFLATGTAIRTLGEEHRVPAASNLHLGSILATCRVLVAALGKR
jgi:uncharacterized protein YbjQ (UPF0145 family)